jgi:branched-subunit amino acid ABC-type transport system permease component
MSLDEVALQALNGLSFGALLFLLASGFTMVFGLMQIVNLAHGAFYLVGGYVGVAVFGASGSFPAAVAAGVAATAAVGLASERLLLRRVAERIATALVDVFGDASPYLLLLGVALLTMAFGQLISNVATAIIVIPIALSAASELGVSARPVLMCVTVAAAAAFLTPVATPANLMIMEPGGYRFGDYWKLGLPLLVLFLVVAVFLVPVFWRF